MTARPGPLTPAARTRRVARRAALLALLVAAAAPAAPPVVPWSEAGEHTNRLVTVEGLVVRATTTPERRCVLEFDVHDPAALRVILLVPMVTTLPRQPDRLFEGRRVQATGRVHRYAGKLEMILSAPDQLEVVGLTASPAPPPASAPAAPPPTVPPPPAAPPPGPDPACLALAAQRTDAVRAARALTDALAECLASDRRGCAALGDRLGPALSRLDAVEQQLAERCP